MDINPLEVILFLLGFGSILFLTYVTTRYVASRTGRTMRGKYIRIVDTISLGTDKRIHLVKAGEQYVLIATTSKSVEFLTLVDLGDDKAREAEEFEKKESRNVFDFKTIFEKYVNTYKSKRDGTIQQDNDETSTGRADRPDFRSNLGRLRAIMHKSDKQVEKNGDDSTNEK